VRRTIQARLQRRVVLFLAVRHHVSAMRRTGIARALANVAFLGALHQVRGMFVMRLARDNRLLALVGRSAHRRDDQSRRHEKPVHRMSSIDRRLARIRA